MPRIRCLKFSALCSLVALIAATGCDSMDEPTRPDADRSIGVEVRAAAAHGPVLERVTGTVQVFVPGWDIVETYSFSAIKYADGAVTGEWQVEDPYPNWWGFVKAHGNVTCFNIQPDGKTVWMGGTTERNDLEQWYWDPNRRDAVWTVVDNGSGANSPSDEATDFGYGAPNGKAAEHCESGNGETNLDEPVEILQGNVQVKR